MILDASARWWEEHRPYAAPYIRFRFQQVRDGSGEQASSDMVAAYTALIHAAQQAGKSATANRRDAWPTTCISCICRP